MMMLYVTLTSVSEYILLRGEVYKAFSFLFFLRADDSSFNERGDYIMDVTKIVAKMRLVYHSNAIDFVNVANQLHLLKDEKANLKNKNHLKECLDCYDRLGYKLPKEFIQFKNDE